MNAGFEHDISSFGINIDVEFRRWSDVADLKIRTAHQNDFLDPVDNIRRFLKGGCDIRQRAKRAKCDGSRLMSAQGVDDEVDRVPVGQRHFRIRQDGTVEASFTAILYMLGGNNAANG